MKGNITYPIGSSRGEFMICLDLSFFSPSLPFS